MCAAAAPVPADDVIGAEMKVVALVAAAVALQVLHPRLCVVPVADHPFVVIVSPADAVVLPPLSPLALLACFLSSIVL